jgi:hypothetical protein
MDAIELVTVLKHGWKVIYRYWLEYGVYEELGAIRA